MLPAGASIAQASTWEESESCSEALDTPRVQLRLEPWWRRSWPDSLWARKSSKDSRSSSISSLPPLALHPVEVQNTCLLCWAGGFARAKFVLQQGGLALAACLAAVHDLHPSLAGDARADKPARWMRQTWLGVFHEAIRLFVICEIVNQLRHKEGGST